MPRSLIRLTAGTQTRVGERSIRGLIVPFGVPAQLGWYELEFDAESLRVSEAERIPLLFQHDGRITAGYATDFEVTDDGVYGTFEVESTETGDRVIREATFGSRTGFSIGIQLDAEVVEEAWSRLWSDEDEGPVMARGRLLEVSHVSVPAFDDARIDEVTDTVAAPADDAASAGLAGDTQEGTVMARRLPVTASASATPPTIVHADGTAPAAPVPAPPAQASAPQAPAAPAPAPAQPAPTAEAAAPAPHAAPAPNPLAHAQVGTEAEVYFDGGEHSFVRDAFHARMSGDTEAAARLHRFNAQLVELAAIRSGFPEIIPPGYRGEMLVQAIDRGRPIVSRLGEARITLTDATPFRIPIEGDFTGVGDHVEGTAHVAAGTLTVDDTTVNPKAVSGAFEVSRELVDSSNPAIDRLALNAMLRNYRDVTEGYAATTYSGAAVPVVGGAGLEAELIDFLDDRDLTPAFIAANPTFYSGIALEQAGDGRARYPYLNPTNAAGQTAAGFRGISVQGVDLIRAGKVDAGEAIGIVPEDVLWGESNVLTFRFDEVQGPGVIKLALFAYVAAHVLRPTGVRTWSYTAPTP
ncbi:HK97 family phage prohead protease [Cellulosimicrobium sp. 22601]|uniref:HK97 family phage prohead protease n=1 Tax=unclassified Cellulosimicrobium TaxID=2624466 RepID=UPI003F830F27